MANIKLFSGLANIKVVAIDLDGVVYQGKTMIAGADQAILWLRQHGLSVVFATNSSVRTNVDIAEKLTQMGIQATENEVITSTSLVGLSVKNLGSNKRVFVLGNERLKEEIAQAGALIVIEPPCDIVVVGLDTSISYNKIQQAMEAILGGAIFIACNRDARFTGDAGRIFPGCGPIVAAVEAGVGFPPHYIPGKPNIFMLEIIAQRYQVKPDEILVVGDGMDSDIKMAANFGSPSVFIVPTLLKSSLQSALTTYSIDSLSELPGLFNGVLETD